MSSRQTQFSYNELNTRNKTCANLITSRCNPSSYQFVYSNSDGFVRQVIEIGEAQVRWTDRCWCSVNSGVLPVGSPTRQKDVDMHEQQRLYTNPPTRFVYSSAIILTKWNAAIHNSACQSFNTFRPVRLSVLLTYSNRRGCFGQMF